MLVGLLCACTPPQSLLQKNSFPQDREVRGNPDAPTVIRMIRCYGKGGERMAPILLMNTQNASQPFGQSPFGQNNSSARPTIGSASLVLEFDVSSSITPTFVVRFVHCSIDWQEDNNTFINDPAQMRTSLIEWNQLSVQAEYARYRGKVMLPNAQVQFRFSGNWKAKVYDLSSPDLVLAETRFFVVQPDAEAQLSLQSDMYKPQGRVSPAAILADLNVSSQALNLSDVQVSRVALYRNQRWYEPFLGGEASTLITHNRYGSYLTAPLLETYILGSLQTTKQFRVRGVQAQNEYRILPADNLTLYPPGNAPSRPLRFDLRRNGNYLYRADDGVLVTDNVSSVNDDYAHVEFVFDPEGFPTAHDMYVVGSFNAWQISSAWKMQYDDVQRLYTLRQWVRRGRHNYLYATGHIESRPNRPDALNFEEYEGNVVSAGHTFIGFVYSRELQFGGYDAIVGVARANTLGR